MKKKISMLLVFTMILSLFGGVTAANAADGVVEAVYGTPVLDGNATDAIWADATAYMVGNGTNKGDFKMVWDDNALYILAVVDDANLDKTGANVYEQDGIEIFVDEKNDKTTSYGSDDVHYRVNYDNERSTDAGETPLWYTKTSVRYGEDGVTPIGYIVEACFQWNEAAPANDALVGFDAQINVCSGGGRQGSPCIFDTTGNAYQNTGLFGNLKLTGKLDTDVTPANPYGLMYYIEEVESRNLSVYVNPEVVEGPLKAAKDLIASGSYTQAEIDAAYAAIQAALKALDDGSGMENPESLPEQGGIPDLMTFLDGSKVETAEDWEERREEILDLYSYYMYGYMPDKAQETLTYKVKDNIDPMSGNDRGGKILEITVEANGSQATFDVLFTLPDPEKNPPPEGGYPYFVEYAGYKMNFWGMEWYTGPSGNQTYAAERGYAGVAYDPTSVASDSFDRTGAFYTLYPYGEDYKSQNGSLMGWAWGVSKIIDALEAGADKELNINAEYSLVGGVSRYGKGASVAAAYEPRIKVAIPSCSGAGGLAIYRTNNQGKVYDLSMLGGSENWVNDSANEPLSNLQGGEAYWFCGNFAKIPGVDQIPVDQHMLAALVADPDRHMIIVTGVTSEGWNNTEGQTLAFVASQEAWDLLGVSDQNNMIIHHDGHAILTSDMQYILDYCDVHLYGKDPSEVESNLDEMKANVFLEGNINNLYEEFDPYMDTIANILGKHFYQLEQNGPALSRINGVPSFTVTVYGQQYMDADETLTFLGTMTTGEETESLKDVVMTFGPNTEKAASASQYLPASAENGSKVDFVCAQAGLNASYVVYSEQEMEQHAVIMGAQEFGGSMMDSVTGSTTLIGTVTRTENLALRSAPEVGDDTFIAWLPRNSELIVYSVDENGWAFVSTSDMATKGYVQFKYIKEEGYRLEVGNTFVDAPHYNGLAEIKQRTNIYAEPSLKAAIVDYVSQGDKVSIVRTVTAEEGKGTWLYIQTESGMLGYIPAANADQTLSAGATTYAFHSGATVYVADTNNLRLRTEPNGDFIDWIPEGTGIVVLEDLGNGWVKVLNGEQEGYVMSRYLDSRKALTEGNASISVPGEVQAGYFDQGGKAVVNSEGELNFRSGPGYNFDKMNGYGGGLKDGTELTVLADDGYGWVKVLHPETGEEVWVSRSFLAKPAPGAADETVTEEAPVQEVPAEEIPAEDVPVEEAGLEE